MAIRKALLVREVDGVKYKIYPKTSADIVVYGDTTVEKALNNFAENLSKVSSESINATIKASCDELYNKIMGVTDDTAISDAYDTLKEIGAWIDEHGEIVSTFTDNIEMLNNAIKQLKLITIDGGEISIDSESGEDDSINIKDIKFKRGTAKRWEEINPVLDSGEPGFEYDTGKLKIGDGIHNWKELGYLGDNSNNDIEFIDKYNNLPDVGIPNTLYCVADDKLIYHYNPASYKYEPFGASGSFDPTIITKINGGKANG